MTCLRLLFVMPWLLLICGRAEAGDAGGPQSDKSQQTLNLLITRLVLDNLPHEFEDTRHWGKTSKRWDGLHISRKGLRIITKRRMREVNHGTWRRYRVSLKDPANQFQARVYNVRREEDGRVALTAEFVADLHVFGRVSKWVKGVQLFSINTDADARVRLEVDLYLESRLDLNKLPPDVVLAPEVSDARLALTWFQVNRISQLRGDLAEEIGRAMKSILKDKIAERQPKLTQKINDQIAQHQDDLRFSLHEMIGSGWSKIAPTD